MASVKLNVLHLHASDYCRFAIASSTYPNLTKGLTGAMDGHYSHEDIMDIISFATNRGIRVVPEFDIPGHSRGLTPLKSSGLQFCSGPGSMDNQLYNDPEGHTLAVIKALFKEMSSLFPDNYFHIGGDETRSVMRDEGRCLPEDTSRLEKSVLSFVERELNKHPIGWEELEFDSSAARPRTTINTWARHTAAEAIEFGHAAIESAASHFYLTNAVEGGPGGWTPG